MRRVDRHEHLGMQWVEDGPWWAFAIGTAVGWVGYAIVCVGDWVQDLACLLGWRFVTTKMELIEEGNEDGD